MGKDVNREICVACGKPATVHYFFESNCEACSDKKRAYIKRRKEERLAALKAKYKYFLEDGTELSGDYWCGESAWRGYSVSEVQCDTLTELVDRATISSTDQHGGDHDCWGLFDAPEDLRDQVLKALNLKFEDIEHLEGK